MRLESTLILSLFVSCLAGCPSGQGPGDGNANTNANDNSDANTNGNDNDNDNTNGNDNGNDNAGGIEPGVEIAVPNEGALHVPTGQQVTYQTNPPASGSHWSEAGIAPVEAGVYDEALEEEQWIHNLEHGYVVVLYDCKGPCQPSVVEELETLFEAARPSVFGNRKMVITAYDGLPFSFLAIAWDRELHLADFDEELLLDFYDRYVDQGPELTP